MFARLVELAGPRRIGLVVGPADTSELAEPRRAGLPDGGMGTSVSDLLLPPSYI